jgi:hypothetical protein
VPTDVCDQKFPTTKYFDILPQSAVYKQWHYIGGLYFFLKTSQHMGGGVVNKNLFPNWTINLHIPYKVRDFLTRWATVSFLRKDSVPWVSLLYLVIFLIYNWVLHTGYNTAVNDDIVTKTLKKVLVVSLKYTLLLQHSLEAWSKARKTSLLMLGVKNKIYNTACVKQLC